MKKNIILICVILGVFNQWIYANGAEDYIPKLNAVTLPSPSSQVYQRFTGYAPNLATGAVNVAIPLYTLKLGSLSIPFNLSYQSNGIKPTDPFLPLGYGWTLQPGLRITRTIIGNPDDVTLDRNIDMHIPYDWSPTDDCYFDKMLNGIQFDNMQDVFTICLPGGNVPFILKYTGSYSGKASWKAITFDTPWKIEVLQERQDQPPFSLIHGFKVTDENGIIYRFGNETGIVGGIQPYLEMSESTRPIPTSYLLRQIELPGKGDINFEWNINHIYPFPYSSSYQKMIDYTQSSQSSIPEDDEIVDYYDSGFTLANSYLKKITSDMVQISFGYHENLESITVTANDKTVKRIELNIEDRLLQKISIDNDEIYSFDYDEKRFMYTNCCSDFCGYYDGRSNYRDIPSFNYKIPYTDKTRIIAGTNKEPSPYDMTANIIKRIIYPTGGSTSFEYEPNRIESFNCGGISTNICGCIGGGLRICRTIEHSEIGDQKDIVKIYKYGRDESGYGNGTIYPGADSHIKEEFAYWTTPVGSTDYYRYRRLSIMSSSLYSNYFVFNLPVWYDEVVEYSFAGKTVYKYQYDPDYLEQAPCNDSFGGWVFHRDYPSYNIQEYNNIFQEGPLLTEKAEYDIDGKMVSYIKRQYDLWQDLNERTTGLFLTRVATNAEYSTCGQYDFAGYDWMKVHISLQKYKLASTESMTDNVIQTQNYSYNKMYIFNPASVTTHGKDNKVIKEKYIYPYDDALEVTDDKRSDKELMLTGNRVTLPVRIQYFVNDSLAFQKTTQYKSVFYDSNTGHCPLIVPVREFFRIGDAPEECRISYPYYNEYGKISSSITNGEKNVYIWGYKGMYPVAVIKNATYHEVIAILGEDFLKEIVNKIVPTFADMIQINNLRRTLRNAMIYTYTYQPLIGLLSETDPAETTIYYSYDQAGRLIEKYRISGYNDEKEMIEKYEYQY